MKFSQGIVAVATALSATVLTMGCQKTAPQNPRNVRRVGMVIGLKEDKIEEYKKLHANNNPGVRDLLNKYNFEGDMAKLSAEKRNIEWLKVCDPMQTPLPGAEGWTEMEQVYYNP
ncbi:MAG: hypothetical protein ACYS67_19030 [Planctomycetota bacterium]|jgi:L-rhamnose mutarotase